MENVNSNYKLLFNLFFEYKVAQYTKSQSRIDHTTYFDSLRVQLRPSHSFPFQCKKGQVKFYPYEKGKSGKNVEVLAVL